MKRLIWICLFFAACGEGYNDPQESPEDAFSDQEESELTDYRGNVCSAQQRTAPTYGILTAFSGTPDTHLRSSRLCVLNDDPDWARNQNDMTVCRRAMPGATVLVYIELITRLQPGRRLGVTFDAAWLDQAKRMATETMNFYRSRGVTVHGIWLDTLDPWYHCRAVAPENQCQSFRNNFSANIPRLVEWVHSQNWKIGGNLAQAGLPRNLPDVQLFDYGAIEKTGDGGFAVSNPTLSPVVASARDALDGFPVRSGGRILMTHGPVEGDRALALATTVRTDVMFIGPTLGQGTCGQKNTFPCWGEGGATPSADLGQCAAPCELAERQWCTPCSGGAVYYNDTLNSWNVNNQVVGAYNGLIRWGQGQQCLPNPAPAPTPTPTPTPQPSPQPPAAPTLLTPADSATVPAGATTFEVRPAANASRHYFLICTRSDFQDDSCRNIDGGLPGIEPQPGTNRISVELSAGQTYYWKVRSIGVNDVGGWGSFSARRILYVQAQSPPPPPPPPPPPASWTVRVRCTPRPGWSVDWAVVAIEGPGGLFNGQDRIDVDPGAAFEVRYPVQQGAVFRLTFRMRDPQGAERWAFDFQASGHVALSQCQLLEVFSDNSMLTPRYQPNSSPQSGCQYANLVVPGPNTSWPGNMCN